MKRKISLLSVQCLVFHTTSWGESSCRRQMELRHPCQGALQLWAAISLSQCPGGVNGSVCHCRWTLARETRFLMQRRRLQCQPRDCTSAKSEVLRDAGSAGPRDRFPQGRWLDVGVRQAQSLAGELLLVGSWRVELLRDTAALAGYLFVWQEQGVELASGSVTRAVWQGSVLRRTLSLVYSLLLPSWNS